MHSQVMDVGSQVMGELFPVMGVGSQVMDVGSQVMGVLFHFGIHTRFMVSTHGGVIPTGLPGDFSD